MTTFQYLIALLGCAAATYLTRAPALLLSDRIRLPQRLLRFMGYIGPAVITALIAPSLFAPEGVVNLNPVTNLYLPAALVTAVVSLLWKKPLPAILAGMAAAFLLSLL